MPRNNSMPADFNSPRRTQYARSMSCAGAEEGWRMTMPESFQNFTAGTELLPNGMMLGYYDFLPKQDIVYDFEMSGSAVQFGGVVSGGVRLTDSETRGSKGVVLNAPQEAVLRIGRIAGQSRLKGGSRVRMFAVILSENLLAELLVGLGEYERFLDKTNRSPGGLDLLYTKPLSPQFEILISQLLHCSLCGGVRRLYLEGMALEMLALQLDRLTCKPPPKTALSRSDIDRLYAARELLFERIDNPPGLKELAAHTCLNEFKLKQGFRELFGNTVYGALREYRMETARSMFLDSDMTVGSVAAAVGYTNMSHFIAAFRERFGVTPGTLAKQSRRIYRNS